MKTTYLRLLTKSSLSTKDVIAQKSIAHSKNKPFTFIDKNFNQIETIYNISNVKSINVFKITKSGTLKNWLSEISDDIKKLCFPETQIPPFCRKYSSWLSNSQSGSTFLLFNGIVKKTEQICIAQIIKKGDLYHIYFDLLENMDDVIFEHEDEHRIIVPII